MTEFINQLNNLTPLGVIALLGIVIYNLIVNRGKNNHDQENFENLRDNHLHEIRDSLNRIENSLNRNNEMTNRILNDLTYIKARINGKK